MLLYELKLALILVWMFATIGIVNVHWIVKMASPAQYRIRLYFANKAARITILFPLQAFRSAMPSIAHKIDVDCATDEMIRLRVRANVRGVTGQATTSETEVARHVDLDIAFVGKTFDAFQRWQEFGVYAWCLMNEQRGRVADQRAQVTCDGRVCRRYAKEEQKT